jgi:hypothetical protein
MFKEACKSHMNLPIISSGVEVRKPMPGWGALEAGDRMAYMVEVVVSDGDVWSGEEKQRTELFVSDNQCSLSLSCII